MKTVPETGYPHSPGEALLVATLLRILSCVQEENQTLKKETIDLKARLKAEELRSLTDELTGLPNHRAFWLNLQDDYNRVLRQSQDRAETVLLSIFLMDLDHFKNVNDQLGHLQGDEVLKKMARLLEMNHRKTDSVSRIGDENQTGRQDYTMARYGGEEFAVILTDCLHADALLLANEVRRLIEQSTKNETCPVTASFGIATLQPGETLIQLVQKADEALYAAKHQGRNVVVGWQDNSYVSLDRDDPALIRHFERQPLGLGRAISARARTLALQR